MDEAPDGPPGLWLGDDGVAVLSLARPRQRNRLDDDDLRALQRQLHQLQAEPPARVRAVVLRASGPVFCAGFDLEGLAAAAAQAAHPASADAAAGPSHPASADAGPTATAPALLADPGAASGGHREGRPAPHAQRGPALFAQTVDLLAALPQPTVACLQGPAHGGGADLALACDFRLGCPATRVQIPAARLGLHFYPSGLLRAVQRLGLQAAQRLYLHPEPLDADELLRLGYLTQCLSAEALPDRAAALARELAGLAPGATRAMKLTLQEMAGASAPATTGTLERVWQDRAAASLAGDELRLGLARLRAPR